MLIKGNIEFRKAIVVDRKLLEEIENIITAYYGRPRYSAILENDDKIMFDSIDEILEYDNYEKRKINILNLLANQTFNLTFHADLSFIHNYKHTVVGGYETKNNNDSILIVEKIQESLNKSKQPLYYTLLSKVSMMYLVIIIGIISLMLNIYNRFQSSIEYSSAFYINTVIISALIFYIIGTAFSKIIGYFFKPVIFNWGKEVERIGKIKSLRGNIFWVIVVGAIMAYIL